MKKILDRTSQFMQEAVRASEVTKFDDKYDNISKNIDVITEFAQDAIKKTNEYLQPNPAARIKMQAVGVVSNRPFMYPQTEAQLGESMIKCGRLLGNHSNYGNSLVETGEVYKQMAGFKYDLEEKVNQDFVNPLQELLDTEIKNVNDHRRKLYKRRLDYDGSKRTNIAEEVVTDAKMRLNQAKNQTEILMVNIVENDMAQISHLSALVNAQLDFHKKTVAVLTTIQSKLENNAASARERLRVEHIPMPVADIVTPTCSNTKAHASGNTSDDLKGGASNQPKPPSLQSNGNSGRTNTIKNALPAGQPCCRAQYDFEATSPEELALKDGQLVFLISQIDDNWFEGVLPGGEQTGRFPISYVHVVTPLPPSD